MTPLTLIDLKHLILALQEARLAATDDSPTYCRAPILGDDGLPYRLEHKPLGTPWRLRQAGFAIHERDGQCYVEVLHGVHGRAFLAIDPATGAICCARCAEEGR